MGGNLRTRRSHSKYLEDLQAHGREVSDFSFSKEGRLFLAFFLGVSAFRLGHFVGGKDADQIIGTLLLYRCTIFMPDQNKT